MRQIRIASHTTMEHVKCHKRSIDCLWQCVQSRSNDWDLNGAVVILVRLFFAGAVLPSVHKMYMLGWVNSLQVLWHCCVVWYMSVCSTYSNKSVGTIAMAFSVLLKSCFSACGICLCGFVSDALSSIQTTHPNKSIRLPFCTMRPVNIPNNYIYWSWISTADNCNNSIHLVLIVRWMSNTSKRGEKKTISKMLEMCMGLAPR